MKLRNFRPSDNLDVNRIYSEFYWGNEYPYFNKLQCPFVVTDDNDKIIVAGGVKPIAEAIFVTDKNRPVKTRLDALLNGLGAVILTAGTRHNQIHAFVNKDESYVKVLQHYGFKLIDAKLLVLDIGEPHG